VIQQARCIARRVEPVLYDEVWTNVFPLRANPSGHPWSKGNVQGAALIHL
jgi:hypothetical protein